MLAKAKSDATVAGEAAIIRDAMSSFCFSPQNVKERKGHEHERHLSRHFSW